MANKKGRQHNDLQNTTQDNNNWAIRTPQKKTGRGNSGAPEEEAVPATAYIQCSNKHDKAIKKGLHIMKRKFWRTWVHPQVLVGFVLLDL